MFDQTNFADEHTRLRTTTIFAKTSFILCGSKKSKIKGI